MLESRISGVGVPVRDIDVLVGRQFVGGLQAGSPQRCDICRRFRVRREVGSIWGRHNGGTVDKTFVMSSFRLQIFAEDILCGLLAVVNALVLISAVMSASYGASAFLAWLS